MSPNPGPLRLKGSNPPSKISKKKKKPPITPATSTTAANAADPPPPSDQPSTKLDTAESESLTRNDHDKEQEVAPPSHSPLPLSQSEKARVEGEGEEREEDPASTPRNKTPAELDREHRRRQRLNHRLEREGLKSHKQRVEELNRYLSGLSEHHDMPRIGPG